MTNETKTAVLSKLRAPVADERVSPPLPAAWGSAINDAGDGHVDLYSAEQMQEYARAALASAPVAGEAKNYPGENVAERLDNMADDQPPGSQAQSDLYAAATIWRKHIAHRAAPQASTVAREAQPSRQTLLDAIWRHGNARAMAEHNIACRDEVRNTADALLALFDAAPQASAEPVGWFDTSTSSGMIRWRPGLTASSFPEGHPFYAGPVAPQPTEEGGDNGPD